MAAIREGDREPSARTAVGPERAAFSSQQQPLAEPWMMRFKVQIRHPERLPTVPKKGQCPGGCPGDLNIEQSQLRALGMAVHKCGAT